MLENSFLESLLNKDKELLVYLNNFGSEQWDPFWLFITDQRHWIPLFLLILVLCALKLGTKKMVFLVLFLVVIVAFSDQFTNLMKNLTTRLRPCNTPELKGLLREFSYKPKGFSFWSGHAFVSTTFTTFIILLMRRYYKYIYFLVLFPMFFGLSRIYLGVHFPIDITTGYIVGFTAGCLFYKLFMYLHLKIFKETLV